MAIIRTEEKRDVYGVPGRAGNVVTWEGNGSAKAPREIANQEWTTESRPVYVSEWGEGRVIRAKVRFDDSCRNGHPSFSITGEIFKPGARDVKACGCIHDEIARYFPELAPLIPWHLVSTDGPMHYVANTLYHASDRDHSGRKAGDPSRFEYAVSFGDVPALHMVTREFAEWLEGMPASAWHDGVEIIDLSERKDNFTYKGFTLGGYPGATAWHKAPFKSEVVALAFADSLRHGFKVHRIAVDWSEGKPRDLDAARRCGVWLDATDADLMQDRDALRAALEARVPDLLRRFRSEAIDPCGFLWNAAEAESGEAGQ